MSVGGTSDAALGSELGGYRIEALLGRGGMGAVYRAEETALGRKVALKVIAPELARDERFRERFLRESRIAASLDHPHIVPIFRAGEEDGALFLAMRYVQGTDLAKLLRAEGALAPARAIALLEQVAEALDAAHEKGLVHRDVKPSNVLIAVASGRENAYLADFGLTKRTGSLSGISALGDIVGTLEYLAPEQITGDDVEARADLYSLGCVLYECLTGQPPFPRATDVALLWAHVHEQPQRPSAVRPELPHAVGAVVERALHKEPARRYATAGELVAAARAALGLVEAPPIAPSGRRWARSTRARLAFAFAGLALCLLAVLALVAIRGDETPVVDRVRPNGVGAIDPASNTLVQSTPVGEYPEHLVVDDGSVWVANAGDHTVSRIESRTGQVTATKGLTGAPVALNVSRGVVWIGMSHDDQPTSIVRLTGVPNESAVHVVELARGPGLLIPALTSGSSGLWASLLAEPDTPDTFVLSPGGAIHRLDVLPVDCKPVGSGIAAATVWIGCEDGRVVRVNEKTRRRMATTRVGTLLSDLAVGAGAVWATDTVEHVAWRVDPVTGRATRTIPVGERPEGIAFGFGSVWVASRDSGTVSRIDPDSNRVVASIRVGRDVAPIAVGDGRVWVASQGVVTPH